MKHFLLGFFLLSTSFFAYGDTLVKDLNEGYFSWSSDQVIVTQILEANSGNSKLFSNGNCEVYIPPLSVSGNRLLPKGSYKLVGNQYSIINSNHVIIISFNAKAGKGTKSYIACTIPKSKYPTIPKSKYPRTGSLTVSELNKELQGSGIVIVAD